MGQDSQDVSEAIGLSKAQDLPIGINASQDLNGSMVGIPEEELEQQQVSQDGQPDQPEVENLDADNEIDQKLATE